MDIDKKYTIKVTAEEKEIIEHMQEQLENITNEYNSELNGEEISSLLLAIAYGFDCPSGNLEDIVYIKYED